MKVTRQVAYTYTIQMDSYRAIQLVDILTKVISTHPSDLSPQELSAAQILRSQLGAAISITVD